MHLVSGLEWVYSAQVEIHFLSSLAWDGFDQHMFRYILCSRWHGRDLVNTCSDAFCDLTFIGGICPLQVELHFESSLVWEVFDQSTVRYILSHSWLGRGFVNT